MSRCASISIACWLAADGRQAELRVEGLPLEMQCQDVELAQMPFLICVSCCQEVYWSAREMVGDDAVVVVVEEL